MSPAGRAHAIRTLRRPGQKKDLVFKRPNIDQLGKIVLECFYDDRRFQKQRMNLVRDLANHYLESAFELVGEEHLPISDLVQGNQQNF